MPVPETGTRPARPIPYRTHITPAVNAAQNALSLTFNNIGSGVGSQTGVVLYVFDRVNRALPPKRYTVEAGKQLADKWSLYVRGAPHR